MPDQITSDSEDVYRALHRVRGKLERLEPLFSWLRWFYPRAKGVSWYILLYVFLPQKILRVNGGVPWPVYFTSRILYPRNIQVGNHSPIGLSGGCYVQARNGIIVGHNLRMGPNVGLISANHDVDDYDRWMEAPPIRIGDDVWIGMNSVVLPGVRIGDNVVIASNSCVTRDIPSNSIAAGSPCTVTREKPSYQGRDYSKL